ncbi:hypothetical protein B0H17DRAFT_1193984 [Mycena rosella]|uniref:Uncharacterized protein n=1 Tax=Mycena rosella TaxID=1033263 RepID=A0AAD7GS74_MYCRO|nr:hypothetical protein B0H17DRAFT_1193984 [Mycena rosella]
MIIRAVAALGGVAIDLPESYEGKDGFLLFDGARLLDTSTILEDEIATLAPNSGLLGKNAQEAALVDHWIRVIETEVGVHTTNIYGLVQGNFSQFYNKPIHNTFLERQLRRLHTLEKHIATRTFFVGERITVADVCIAATLTPELMKAPVYVAQKKEKEVKPAPAPAAPMAAKKAKPKAEAEEEDDDNGVPEEPKAKNPLDDLPKSTLNPEDWKRAYSNKEMRGAGGALEWFYEQCVPSRPLPSFFYPEELRQTFMSSNQIGGFFNRLEAARKYLFGSVGVLGAANASLIAGALVLRGQEAEPFVSCTRERQSLDASHYQCTVCLYMRRCLSRV